VVEAVEAIGITVGDLDRSIGFFRDVLAFTVTSGPTEASGQALEELTGVFAAHTRSARLSLGGQTIVLSQYLAPRGRPVPPDLHSNDRVFQHVAIVVSDMDRAYQHLRAHGVRHVSSAPQTLPAWNRAAAGIRAFYFADPDDHTLEIIWFPPGKGDPRWRPLASATAGAAPLFLGIDHTAIAVGDTARSLRLYRDTLGLRVAGESENFGTEQEHLNAVFGAHLRITALRAASGPGIELLEYVAPRDGRPAPGDLHANDLARWQTVLRTRLPLASALRLALASGASPAPGRVVEPARAGADLAPEADLAPAQGASAVAAIDDPDGHGLLLALPARPGPTAAAR
jgi:catechol 2,3-dioxygenase-like lactoylglutathione lyase family enzyme